MGNSEAPKRVSKFSQPSRYARNSYSLDQNSFFSNQLSQQQFRESSVRPKQSPILLDNIAQLAQPLPQIQSSQQFQAKKPIIDSPEATIRKSISVSTAKAKPKIQLNSKLNKLTEKNEDLRKELIQISAALTQQLRRKKFTLKKRQNEQQKKQQPVSMALKRQLQNGYKEISRLKRHIENLKKNEGNAKNQDLTNEIQAKINNVEFQISEIRFEIDNAREVEKDILLELQQTAGIADFGQLQPFKQQIERLRKHSKRQVKNQRTRFQKQKIMQEYMFQLQRRKRQINGQYLPEIKSYANKNFVPPEPKHDKKKSQEYANYKPAEWQARNILEEIKTLKEKHEEYHVKMDKALKGKNVARQENQRLKLLLQASSKELQILTYKKERYMQLVMSNIDFLMNENEFDGDSLQMPSEESETIKTVTKGNDVQDQVQFNDHNLIKNIDYKNVKIVSINLWYTNKHQISVIQAIYSNGKDCFLGNKSAQVTEEMEKEMLQVDEGDYIKNIMGIFNKRGAIEFLAFYSSKGKARQFGKQMINGLNFTLGLTKRERPVCISGCTFFDGNNWRINKLIVDVVNE